MRRQIESLRQQMKAQGIDFYIVTTTDAHNSEYVSDHDMVLKYMTGFSGSNGTLLVTADEALLWTDGRYYIQCEKEIAGSGIKMMREGDDRDPSIDKYIGEHIRDGRCVGYNGYNITRHKADRILSKVSGVNVKTDINNDLAGDIWDSEGNRPERPHNKVYEHELKYAGEDVGSKIARVRNRMCAENAKSLIISSLPDVMWLYNLRGSDVLYNPIAMSYAFVTAEGEGGEAYLFVQAGTLDDKTAESLKDKGVKIKDYDDVNDFLASYEYRGDIYADPRELSVRLYETAVRRLAECGPFKMVDKVIPTTELKAVKNETEIAMMKEYFKRDSAAMAAYLYSVKSIMGCELGADDRKAYEALKRRKIAPNVSADPDGFDELKAGKLCDEIRLNTDGCFDLSFTTIAAYGPNAAMMHYEASEDSYAKIERQGMLLTDCGGQYPGATTDVTRTIAVGPVSDKEKKYFTLVLKGWLALMHATWIEGCTGRNLDILARQYLWNEGTDYKCGTGHGVGYCLGVHEGPQNIRWRYIPDSTEAVLHPGMVVTNEPGVYKEGGYGIRTENTMLVVKKFENDGDTYLGFENLTLVPIDSDLVDERLLDDKEKQWLREYNSEAYKWFEES